MKALLKKQIKELMFPLIKNGKKGGVRSRAATAVLAVILVISYISIGASLFALSSVMMMAFAGGEYSYIPFASMSIIAFLLGLFICGFYANGALYSAKDNELLLSMPLSFAKILFVRMTSIYINALLTSVLVLVPTGISWIVFAEPGVVSAIFYFIGIFVFALAVTAVSCMLGFVIAFISSRVKRKNIMQVALTLIFLVLYYIFYFNIRAIINSIIENGAAVAKKLKTYGFLFYAYGKACTGNLLYFIGFIFGTAVLFAVVYFVLSKSFLNIVTNEKSVKRKKQPLQKTAAVAAAPKGLKNALLRRELRRFTASAAYLLNVGLGSFLMIAAAVALVIFKKDVNLFLKSFEAQAPAFLVGRVNGTARIVAAVFTFIISSTVFYTAASVSIEGKTFWILRASPVPAAEILNAKLSAHLLISGVPAILLSCAASFVLETGFTGVVWQALMCFAYVMLFSSFGLWLNVKMPNFTWTDETVPIKQGLPVTLSLFGGWLASLIIGAACFALSLFVKLDYAVLIIALIMVLASRLINSYLTKNGERLFLEM